MIVIFPNNLLLDRVKRHPDGSIKSGEVVNGGWIFKRGDGRQEAWSSTRLVNSWPDHPITEVEVPDSRDYDKQIRHAQSKVLDANKDAL